jgi:hypothetical protein
MICNSTAARISRAKVVQKVFIPKSTSRIMAVIYDIFQEQIQVLFLMTRGRIKTENHVTKMALSRFSSIIEENYMPVPVEGQG